MPCCYSAAVNGRAVPSVDEGDLVEWPPGCGPERVTRSQPRDRQQATLRVRLGNAEDLADRVLAQQVQCRDARPVPACVQRELEVPHRGKHRAVERRVVKRLVAVGARDVGLETRDHEQRHGREILYEPLGRRHDAAEVGVGRHQVGDEPAGHREVPVAVEARDLGAQSGIRDDEPPPRLLVRAVRRLESDLEAVADLAEIDGRLQIERLARRPRRRQQCVDIHR